MSWWGVIFSFFGLSSLLVARLFLLSCPLCLLLLLVALTCPLCLPSMAGFDAIPWHYESLFEWREK